MKKVIDHLLAFWAKKILKKYQPKIIGITGSVGKTSTKEAIFYLLKEKFSVRRNIKNYNTEIGLPLTVIGAQTGGKNPWKWWLIFLKALKLFLKRDKNYPQILILEMGADHPGDIEHLVKIAPCEMAIVTAIGETHLEFFGSLSGVKKEKQKIVSHLKKSNVAILNADDENVLAMTKETVAKVVTFGFQEEALLRASDEMYFYEEGKKPYLIFKWHYNGSVVPVGLKNILTRTQIYSFLAAAAVGLEMRLPMMEIIKIMENFSLPKGRTNLITGIKETQIIDDTYNSSPKAVKAALTVLTELRARRKIAVLGEMLELGSESEKLHQEIGREVFVRGIDLLITTGERARDIARGAKEAGMNDNLIFSFETPGETGRFLQDRITMGDLILIKGSQGVRMEKVVKEIMAEPEKAGELLVRQDEEWLKK